MPHRACALLTCLLIAACGGPDTAQRAVEVRDSAGVRIVQNPGPHLADSTAWVIDTAAAVRIGVPDGDEAYVLGRVAGLQLRPDSSILVADGMTQDLRIFDRAGSIVRRVGGPGDGPGEFRGIAGVHTAGEFLVVEGHRASVLDGSLEFVRRFRPRLLETRAEPPYSSSGLEGFFADGTALMWDYLNACGATRSDGFCEDSVAFFRTNEEGSTLSRFGSFVYERTYTRSGPINVGFAEPHPQAFWAVSGDRFYHADADRSEIRVFQRDGTLEQIARVSFQPPDYARDVLFTAPDFPPGREDDPRMAQAMRSIAELHRDAPLPERLPSFSDLLVDDVGNIWLREYVPPGLAVERVPWWYILDPEGVLRWRVRAPQPLIRRSGPRAEPAPYIGDDGVLSVERDELGVERVVFLPLRKR
jgi:hypothetical protein